MGNPPYKFSSPRCYNKIISNWCMPMLYQVQTIRMRPTSSILRNIMQLLRFKKTNFTWNGLTYNSCVCVHTGVWWLKDFFCRAEDLCKLCFPSLLFQEESGSGKQGTPDCARTVRGLCADYFWSMLECVLTHPKTLKKDFRKIFLVTPDCPQAV